MRKLFCFYLFLFSFTLFSQDTCKISIVKSGFNKQFMYKNEKLKPKTMLTIVSRIPEAKSEMQYAKNYHFFSKTLGYSGGFLIGYPLGTYITGGKPNWNLLFIGLGLSAISIPLELSYFKHATKAKDICNNAL